MQRLKERQLPVHHEVILLLRVAAGAAPVTGRPDAGVGCQYVQAQLMAIQPVDGSCQRAVGADSGRSGRIHRLCPASFVSVDVRTVPLDSAPVRHKQGTAWAAVVIFAVSAPHVPAR